MKHWLASAFIRSIQFVDSDTVHWPSARRMERDLAVQDLLLESRFLPKALKEYQQCGPFDLCMQMDSQRLGVAATCVLTEFSYHTKLPFQNFRRLMKDYFLLCDRHREALERQNIYGLEAMDMGRRAIHNEGAETVMALFEDHFMVDFDTARRFFTLICACHYKSE